MDPRIEDRVRVLRLIEYEGPRSWVESTVLRAIHGTRVIGPANNQRITGVTLTQYPEVLSAAREQIIQDPPAPQASPSPSLMVRRGPVRAEGCTCQQFGKSAVLTFRWDVIDPMSVVTNGKCLVCGELASLDRPYVDNVGKLEESRRAEG